MNPSAYTAGRLAASFRSTPGRIVHAFARSVRDAEMFWRRRLRREHCIERRIYDYRLLLDLRDPGLSRQLLRSGAREPEQRYILHGEVAPGMNVLDLGANLGYYTIMLALLVGPAGRVYAVEPVTGNFDLLRRNVQLNGLRNVQMEQLAIADRDGEKTLTLTAQSNWHSFHEPRLRPDAAWLRKYRRTVVGSMRTTARSLASYLADKPPMDLLRMDIEGYETRILRAVAALDAPKRERMHILFETHPEFYDGGEEMRAALEILCGQCSMQVRLLVSDYQFGSRRHRRIEPAERVFARLGYGPEHIVRLFHSRAVYANLRQEHAIDLICRSECVNAAFLAPARAATPTGDARQVVHAVRPAGAGRA